MRSERMMLHLDIEISNSGAYDLEQEDGRFERAVEYGLRCAVAIDELAQMCCQSISTFKRHFHARYSMSPHRWFTLRKLELAYTIILERDIAIVELTKLCGFNTSSHFIAAFRKRYGISPARLSKQLREEQQQERDVQSRE